MERDRVGQAALAADMGGLDLVTATGRGVDALLRLANLALVNASDVQAHEVRSLLLQLQLQLAGKRETEHHANRIRRLLESDTARRAAALMRGGALSDARTVKPTSDPLRYLLGRGVIGQREVSAAKRIRVALALIGGEGWRGIGAIDMTKLRVDGGKGWTEALRATLGDVPDASRAVAWAAQVEQLPPLKGRRGEDGEEAKQLTAWDVVFRVLWRSESCRELEDSVKARHGKAAQLVAQALKLYDAPAEHQD